MAVPHGKPGRRNGHQSQAWRQLFRTQFRKTKMCRFFAKGECRYGEACPYAHNESEIEHAPDLTKTALCIQFDKGSCLKRSEDCPFAHGREELRTTEIFHESPLCKRTTGMQESTAPGNLLPDQRCTSVPQDGHNTLYAQPSFQLFHQARPILQTGDAAGQEAPLAGKQGTSTRPSRKQRKSNGREPAKAWAEKNNRGATGTSPTGPVSTNFTETLVPDPSEAQVPLLGVTMSLARGLPGRSWGSTTMHVADGMPPATMGLTPGGYHPSDAQTLRGRLEPRSTMPAVPAYTPVLSPTLQPPSLPMPEFPPPFTPEGKGDMSLEAMSRLLIVGGSSGGTPTATTGSDEARTSPMSTDRLMGPCRGDDDDDDDDSPRWMAGPAYVCSTTADYRSVSPGGYSDASGVSGHLVRGVHLPRRCWPRTPSSCASPERHSPVHRWPHTPSSAAALSPSASPSPPRRKRGGGLTPAALEKHLGDIFGTSGDLPYPAPGTRQPISR